MADDRTPKAQDPDAASEAAKAAELARQDAQTEAVAKAGASELPKIGGPMKEPGLGR